MKKTLCSLGLLMSGLAFATTPIDGWYTSLFGGFSYLPDNVSDSFRGYVLDDAKYHSGYDAGGNFGFKSTPIRYEGEITYIDVDLHKFNVNVFKRSDTQGFNRSLLAMANLYYDFPSFARNTLEPYIGVGIGYAFVNSEFNSTSPYGFYHFEATDNAFAYQGTLGLTYNFAEEYALYAGYRYVASTHLDDFGKIFQANLLNAGVTYRFDGIRYK